MTKKFLTLVAVAIFTLSFSSCREKTTGEKVGDAVENVVDDVENAVD
ncbi:hypothetical protein [Dokdonia donghaensis]|nr:hypothetical protein [Dokdonia donghaensis]ANH61305.1 hypothetical protein I597_2408 [Dokdonia donghaensis DSW-1]